MVVPLLSTVPRNVTITSGGNDSGITFTVTGTDASGAALAETITGGNAGIATGTSIFATVTQIAAVGDPAGTVERDQALQFKLLFLLEDVD